MKSSIKTKLAIVAVCVLLASGGGILIWHYHQSPKMETVSAPAIQKPAETSTMTPVLGGKSVSSEKQQTEEPVDQDEAAQAAEAIAWLNSLEKSIQKEQVVTDSAAKESSSSEKYTGRMVAGFPAEKAHEMAAELKPKLESWLSEAIDLGDQVYAMCSSGDPDQIYASRELSMSMVYLIKQIIPFP